MKFFDALSEMGSRALGGIFALGATSFQILTGELGGWDAALKFLIYLMMFDYVTGFSAAVRKKQINSDVMFWGGLRKAGTIGVLYLSVLADDAVNNGAPVFRNMAIYYYIWRESVSTIENTAILGIKFPPKFVEFFAQLKDNTALSPIDKAAKKLAKPGEQTEPISKEVDIVEEVVENKKLAE